MTRDIMPWVLDGAMGTYLEQLGEALDPQLWSAGHIHSNPAIVERVHSDYLRAGAEIVTCSSYQVSYDGFAKSLNASVETTNQYLHDSVRLATNAVLREDSLHSHSRRSLNSVSEFLTMERRKLVAASIGTYGAHLANGSEYSGRFGCTSEYLQQWHLPKLQYMSHLQPDLLALETIPCLDEVKALLHCYAELDTTASLPVTWLSIACNSPTTLNSGEYIEDFCRLVEDSGSLSTEKVMIGINCTHPQYVSSILDVFTEHCPSTRHFVAYPNRGDPWDMASHAYVDDPNLSMQLDDAFVHHAQRWISDCPQLCVVGGCCRTHPALISRLCQTIQAMK